MMPLPAFRQFIARLRRNIRNHVQVVLQAHSRIRCTTPEELIGCLNDMVSTPPSSNHATFALNCDLFTSVCYYNFCVRCTARTPATRLSASTMRFR